MTLLRNLNQQVTEVPDICWHDNVIYLTKCNYLIKVMTREVLKSEFMKVYYKDQFGENEILEPYELEILDSVLKQYYSADTFSKSKITDFEESFSVMGAAYRKACSEYESRGL